MGMIVLTATSFLTMVKLSYFRIFNILINISIILLLAMSLNDAKAVGIFDQYRVHEVKYEKQMKLMLASSKVNHINFASFRIAKIIGNNQNFTFVVSDDGSNLFLTPKIAAGSSVDFSVVGASGAVLDFNLQVIDAPSPSLIKLIFEPAAIYSTNTEASKMIFAMSSGRVQKYYVQKVAQNINIKSKPNIKIIQQNSYRWQGLQGAVLLLKNTDKKSKAQITPNDLALYFSNMKAAFIEACELEPEGETRAFVVFKRRGI
jgi:hypothetical protein